MEASTTVHRAFTWPPGIGHLGSLASSSSLRCPEPSGHMSRGTGLKLSTRKRVTTLSLAMAGTLALSACGAANEGGGSGGSGGGGGG